MELLERLLRRGPGNLRFALLFRSDPGLDVASIVLEGSAVVVTTEQLRFSKPEVGRFFGGDLTRRELTDIVGRTAGWPVAVRIDRSMRIAGTAERVERGKALTRDSLDTRLLRRLPDQDRALLLDLAVLEWIDTELVDEVLESTDTSAGRRPPQPRDRGSARRDRGRRTPPPEEHLPEDGHDRPRRRRAARRVDGRAVLILPHRRAPCPEASSSSPAAMPHVPVLRFRLPHIATFRGGRGVAQCRATAGIAPTGPFSRPSLPLDDPAGDTPGPR